MSTNEVLYFFLILNQVFGEGIPQVPFFSLPADALRGMEQSLFIFSCATYFSSPKVILYEKEENAWSTL